MSRREEFVGVRVIDHMTSEGPCYGQWLTDEPIVRCRDCKFYTPESMTREERGFGVYENVWEPGGCFNPERCSATWDSIAGQMVPVGIVTEPDGFCAWGKRRDG